MDLINFIHKEERKYLKYWPVLLMYVLVFLFSFFTINLTGGHYMSHFMGWILVLFGLLKLEDIDSFAQGFRKYDIFASKNILYSKIYPALEVIIGVFYLINIFVLPVTLLVLAIYISTSLGLLLRLKRGELIDCLCLGVRFKLPLSIVAFLESIIMIVMAVWMLSM